jgi:hypothetical protein
MGQLGTPKYAQFNGKYFSSPMNSKIIEIDHAFVDLYH